MKNLVLNIIILIFGAQTLCWTNESSINRLESEQDLLDIDSLVEDCLVSMNVPGAGIGIVKDDKTIVAKGYGLRNVEHILSVTPRTRFPIGSATKSFTTFLMGQLVDEGYFNWDDPIANYIPYFKLKDPYTTYNVTFRDSLTHITGYPRHDATWFNRGLSREAMIKELKYLKPCYALRERFLYQNLSYMIAAHGAECVTGKSWEELTKEKILSPLEMNDTDFDVTQLPNLINFATGYREKNKEVFSVANIDATTIGPAGSMNSTVEDMNKWVKALLQKGKGLIEESRWDEITTPYVISDVLGNDQYGLQNVINMESYGLGWFIISYRGHKVIFHGGNIEGFSSNVLLIPSKGIGIVVLTNKHLTPMPYILSTMLLDKILQLEPIDWLQKYKTFTDYSKDSYTKEQPIHNITRHENTEPSHPLHEYNGSYTHPAYGKLDISVKKTHLEATLNDMRIPLTHWHYDVFEVAEDSDYIVLEGLKLIFRENVYGDITEIQIPLEPRVSDAIFVKQKDLKLFHRDYLDKFIGDYSYHGFGFLIRREEDTLIVNATGQPPFNLFPERDGLFTVEDYDGYTVQFISDEVGNITAVQLVQPNKSVFTAYRY